MIHTYVGALAIELATTRQPLLAGGLPGANRFEAVCQPAPATALQGGERTAV